MNALKFNVHWWDGRDWRYMATVRAKDETEACCIVSFRFSLKTGKLKAYPHIDNFPSVDRRTQP